MSKTFELFSSIIVPEDSFNGGVTFVENTIENSDIEMSVSSETFTSLPESFYEEIVDHNFASEVEII